MSRWRYNVLLATRLAPVTRSLNLAKLARRLVTLIPPDSYIAESLTVRVEQNDILGIASCLRGLASMALARGDDDRAALLYGAAERLNDDSGSFFQRPLAPDTCCHRWTPWTDG